MSTFVHMELSTSDVDAAKEFYQAVFGWQYQDMQMPEGSYTMVMAGDKMIGGMQPNPMPEMPSNWLGYIGVESVARTLSVIEEHGGKVILGETQAGEMGKLAVLCDPQGAMFAIWEPNMPAATEPAPSKKTSKKKTSKKASAKQEPAPAPAPAPAKKASAKQAPAPAKKASAKKAPAKKASAKQEPAPAKKASAKKAPAKKTAKKGAKK
jgi:predicted enzyme related to lactoylglutathione lyase